MTDAALPPATGEIHVADKACVRVRVWWTPARDGTSAAAEFTKAIRTLCSALLPLRFVVHEDVDLHGVGLGLTTNPRVWLGLAVSAETPIAVGGPGRGPPPVYAPMFSVVAAQWLILSKEVAFRLCRAPNSGGDYRLRDALAHAAAAGTRAQDRFWASVATHRVPSLAASLPLLNNADACFVVYLLRQAKEVQGADAAPTVLWNAARVTGHAGRRRKEKLLAGLKSRSPARARSTSIALTALGIVTCRPVIEHLSSRAPGTAVSILRAVGDFADSPLATSMVFVRAALLLDLWWRTYGAWLPPSDPVRGALLETASCLSLAAASRSSRRCAVKHASTAELDMAQVLLMGVSCFSHSSTE